MKQKLSNKPAAVYARRHYAKKKAVEASYNRRPEMRKEAAASLRSAGLRLIGSSVIRMTNPNEVVVPVDKMHEFVQAMQG